MKFAEIAVLLREIVDEMPGLDGTTITLIPPEKQCIHYTKDTTLTSKLIYLKESMSNR